MSQTVANLMANFLASRVVISSWVGALFTPLPFEDHPSTQARQTGLRNKSQEKQARETIAMIHTWIVSSLI